MQLTNTLTRPAVSRLSTTNSFDQQGYKLLPQFFTQEECMHIRQTYQQHVKHSEKEFYRIKSNSEERNRFTSKGHVVNPFMNLHLDEDPAIAEPFSSFFGSEKVTQLLGTVDHREFGLYKTMYFESNRGTERHFDSDIFETQRRMVGMWVAMEAITPENGGFFIYPFTHKLWQEGHFDAHVYELFTEYRSLSALKKTNFSSQDRGQMLSIYKRGNEILEQIIDEIGSHQMGMHFRMGDMVIFDGNLLHGSFRPADFNSSRNSASAHFLTK